jgi:hypothetical protein
MYNLEQVDKHSIEIYGVELGTGSPIPANKWFKRNDDQKKWLADNVNNQRHQELEREYQERKKQDYHY